MGLPVDGFEGVDAAEIMNGLEGEDRVKRAELAGPGIVLQVSADQANVTGGRIPRATSVRVERGPVRPRSLCIRRR